MSVVVEEQVNCGEVGGCVEEVRSKKSVWWRAM